MFNKVLLEVNDRTYQLLQHLAKAQVYGFPVERVGELLVREGLRQVFGDAALAGAPPEKGA